MTAVVNPTTLSFVPATQNADGTALDPKTVTGVRIGIGSTSGSYTKSVEDTNLTVGSDGKATYPVAALGLSAGTWFVALFTDVSVGGSAVESIASNEVSIAIVPTPNPPTAFTAA